MGRTITELADGWRFWFEAQPEGEGEAVVIPHDWTLEAPFGEKPGASRGSSSQGYHERRGLGWYRRMLALDDIAGKRYFLDFGGVYENSSVYVNGALAGGQGYGYTPFRLEITAFLREGENQLEVRVDNTVAPADRWYTGGGIYRPVRLIETGAAYLDEREVKVSTAFDADYSAVRICVETGVQEPVRGQLEFCGVVCENGVIGITGAVDSAGGMCATREDGGRKYLHDQNKTIDESETEQQPQLLTAESHDGVLVFEVKNSRLWSAEKPQLYTLTLWNSAAKEEKKTGSEQSCGDDTVKGDGRGDILQKADADADAAGDCVHIRLGLREVKFAAGQGMTVNGNAVKLRGVCVHQDTGCRGVAAKKEIWRERLLALKEMGCNAIRPAHHVYAEEFMDLCDELGFYVYEEPFDKWTGGHYANFFASGWQKDLDAMVKRDRNRPSVVIWGVGNEVENQGQPSMLKILEMLAARVRELDASRPVSCAMNPHFKYESKRDMSEVTDIQQFVDEADETEIEDLDEKIRRIAKIGRFVDILSCNYQEQWYERIHEAIPEKLILGTEVYQYFQGHLNQFKNFTEANPSLVPERYPYVIGSMIWTGIDYLGESVAYPAKGWNGALIRTNGARKAGYYLLQSYWSDKPMVHFTALDYSLDDEGVKDHWDMPPYQHHWEFPQFQNTVIPYMIMSNCEEVELYVNDVRYYVPSPKDSPNRTVTGFVTWTPGRVLVIGKNQGAEVCREETFTPGPAVQLAFEPCGGNACVGAAAPHYQLMLRLHAADAEGHPVFRCAQQLRFRVEGPAGILGADSGDAKSWESCTAPCIHLYRGQAGVLIELTGEPGCVRVFADGEGLRSAELVLVVE